MKIRNLFFAAAAALALVACEEKQDFGPAKVEISTATPLDVSETGGAVTVEFVSTVDWQLQGYTDEVKAWLNVSATSGKAAAGVQKIELTALENEHVNRQADLTIFGNVLAKASFTVKQNGPKGEAEILTVQQFIEKADKTNAYRLSGTVSNFKSDYCSFDLTDATGTIYVYSVANKDEWSSKISNGGTVVLDGKYDYYADNSKHEVIDANIISFDSGVPATPTEYPTVKPTPEKVTIAEFLTKPISYDVWYELTGEIVSLDAANKYGNFTIKDDTGTVYIYGMTSEWIGKGNDQSFQNLDLKVTDVVTLGTLRSFNKNNIKEIQGGGLWVAAYYISHEEGTGPAPLPAGSVELTFPDDNSASNGVTTNHYATEWIAKKGDYAWKVYGFNNNNWGNDWTHIRAGSKKATTTATITNTTALPKATAVVLSFTQIEKSLVNSMTLSLYSDNALTTAVGEAIEVPNASLIAGDVTIDIPAASQAENLYYKLTLDLQQGSANGFVRLAKVAYVAAE